MLMRRIRLSTVSLALALATFASAPLQATTVLQMNLDQLTDGAQTIVRGAVVEVKETTVQAGGGQLPALRYRVEVSEVFKGDVPVVKEIQMLEFMMMGKTKAALPGLPVLSAGNEYLLFVAPAGPVGLTSTMGLSQGYFSFVKSTDAEMIVNGADNVGLFRDMDSAALPSKGPVAYSDVARLIRAQLNN